jgi:membrane protease YdiL (CAAX protease family)
LLIFLFGFNFISTFPTNESTLYRVIICIFFLILTVIFFLFKKVKKYWKVSFAFFLAALGMLLNWIIRDLPFRFLYDKIQITEGLWMFDKLSQLLAIAIPIILLTIIFRQGLTSLYICKGNARLWLIIGLSSFIIFAAAGIIISVLNNGWNKTLITLPWLLAFSVFNGFMEELWFRGLFLKKFDIFIDKHLSILVTSLVFSIPHIFARYLSGLGMSLGFFALVFALGMASGYMIYRTKSIWGAVLFHIGYDLFYALAIGFATVE